MKSSLYLRKSSAVKCCLYMRKSSASMICIKSRKSSKETKKIKKKIEEVLEMQKGICKVVFFI